jgi:maltose O-acetyltransferase
MGWIFDRFRCFKKLCLKTYYSAIVDNKGGTISGDTLIYYPQNIKIGRNSFINSGQLFASKNAKIIIGENVMISYNVHIRTDTHEYEKIELPMNRQGMIEKDIIIGNDVWIGFGAQIMAGVKIGDGSIVGAGAIVTKDVEPYSVVAGVPAIKIKGRI